MARCTGGDGSFDIALRSLVSHVSRRAPRSSFLALERPLHLVIRALGSWLAAGRLVGWDGQGTYHGDGRGVC